MCFKFDESPYGLVLHQEPLDGRRERVVSVPVLGKRAGYADGVHTSEWSSRLRFPIRRLTTDANAVVGHHSRCLHFAPNPDAAKELRGHGDHLLVALPGPHYWGKRCHHSDGTLPLFCATCEGVGWNVQSVREATGEYVPVLLRDQLLDAAAKGAISARAHELPRDALSERSGLLGGSK